MKAKFWYSSESQYNGPFSTIDAAKAEAVKTCKSNETVEILQLVEVSEIPKRTWKKP